MKRKVLVSIVSLLLVFSFVSSTVLTAGAASGDVAVTGTMQDTAIPGSGKVYWKYTYNLSSGKAKLDIWGNGYMPNGTDQDWFQTQQNAQCYIYEVNIAEGVKSIMSDAFAGEIYLEKVTLPSTIERIGENAFAYTAIETFNIPAKVSYVNGGMFAGSAITKFTVSSKNPYYVASGGNVYSKDKSTLVIAAPGKFLTEGYKFSIPKTVTEIAEQAFYGSEITSVVIPSNVKSIRKMAFANCGLLEKVVIENGVEYIYDNVFLSCTSLNNLQLPSSVKYIGYCSIGYQYAVAFDALGQALDDAGVSYGSLNMSNYEYYSVLAGYSSSAFSYCYANSGFNLYAPAGSVGETYAKNNGLTYVKSSELSSVKSTYEGVELKWEYSHDVFYYKVFRKSIGGSWGEAICTLSAEETSYVDTEPYQNADNTYTLRVYYLNGYNYYDTKGETIHYVASPVLKSVTNAVGGLRVSWESVLDAKYYYIFRKAPGDTAWTKLGRVSGSQTTYFDKTTENGVEYTYTVIAHDGVTKSSYDATGISRKYVESPTFTVNNTATGVTVKWSAVENAEAYRVYRKTSGGKWQLLEMVEGSKRSFVDTTAKSGTTYYYTVRSVLDGVYSGYASAGTVVKALSMPTLKSADNTVSGVKVTWSKVTGAKGYYVYRKAPGGSWARIANIKSGSTVSYVDKTAQNNKTYVYTVKAYNGSYKSAHETDGITVKFVTAPKVSSAVSTKSGVKIKYNAISGADSYRIYRKPLNGSWQVLGTVKNGTTTYLDKTAKKGQTYVYTVRAYNGSYRSSYYANAIKIKDIY